jgi:ABC-type branched-subunit amino acid transport system substrate-binding protein
MNTHNNTSQRVGRFDSAGKNMNQTGVIYYPGSVATSPSGVEGIIEISINSGTENPTAPPTSSLKDYYIGQLLAVQQLNQRRDILPRNTLISYDMSFGATEWNRSWATPRILANKEKLGLVHMGGTASALVMNTMLEFARYNLSRPVVGSINTLIELSNSTKYPWYLRNGIPTDKFHGSYANIFPEIGWRKFAVLYGDDTSGTIMYETFKELAKHREIEILNNETLRRLPRYASKETYWKDYRANLLELFRCNARIVIILATDTIPQYILELMFDLGARKGDFIFTGAWMSPTLLSSGTPLNIMKRKELLEGTLTIGGAAWIGSFGEQVKKDIAAAYSQTDPARMACWYYDATLTIAYALQMCMQRGLDYTNSAQLMKIMRQTRFAGCSGFVSWLSGSNDRDNIDYTLLNLVKDPVSGEYTMKEVGQYRPTSTLLLNFSAPFVFPDGTSVIPSDLRVVFGDCPFEDKLLREFSSGKHLTIGVIVIVMGLTTILSVLIYKKLWRVKVSLIQKSELSVEDVMFMATIGIEAVQIAEMGPDLSNLGSIIKQTAGQLTGNFSSSISYANGVYWVALNIAFGLIAVWVLLNVFTSLGLENRYKKSWWCEIVGNIAHIALPLLGNVCFIPLISVLMDVYICDQAVGYGSLGYTDSILAKDCYAYCWSKPHTIYAVFASISLICYISSAILLRPVWQDYQSNLHVRSYPLFLVVKSNLQVILVCLSKTLKRWHSFAHSILFLCIITAFGVFLSVKPAYNYKRASFWQVLSCAGVFVLSLIALLNDTVYNNPNFKLVFLVGILWVLLIGTFHTVFGLVFQAYRLPSALYRKKTRDVQTILRFAFTNKVSASEIQPRLNLARENERASGVSSQEFLDGGGRGTLARRIPTLRPRANIAT